MTATSRFVANDDDTVTDALTGLIWSQTLAGGKNVTHAAAEKACKALGEGWRLPTVHELFGLVDHSRLGPAINPAFPGTENDYYWTSTLYAWLDDQSDDRAYSVGFYNGYVSDCYCSYANACVRAVRSVPPPSNPPAAGEEQQ